MNKINIPKVTDAMISKSIRFEERDLKAAKKLGIDVSELLRNHLKEAISAAASIPQKQK